jgi:hypothetical protein
MNVVGFQPNTPAAFTSRIILVLISRNWVYLRAHGTVRYHRRKKTFRLVAQCLKHYATGGPRIAGILHKYLRTFITVSRWEISEKNTVFASVISTPAYFAHPNFLRMILDLFLPPVFHTPSYCSFTSNLTLFWLIIDYWIDSGIYSAFIRIIIYLIIDKSRLGYKITIKYWQNVPYSQLY